MLKNKERQYFYTFFIFCRGVRNDLEKECVSLELEKKESNEIIKVIKPESIGVDSINNQDVRILRVYYNRRENRMMYEFEPCEKNTSNMKQYLPN